LKPGLGKRRGRAIGRFVEAKFIVGYFTMNINLLSLLPELRLSLP
jgi:hypothetical protein